MQNTYGKNSVTICLLCAVFPSMYVLVHFSIYFFWHSYVGVMWYLLHKLQFVPCISACFFVYIKIIVISTDICSILQREVNYL